MNLKLILSATALLQPEIVKQLAEAGYDESNDQEIGALIESASLCFDTETMRLYVLEKVHDFTSLPPVDEVFATPYKDWLEGVMDNSVEVDP